LTVTELGAVVVLPLVLFVLLALGRDMEHPIGD
jgi:hypothetical protein